jgi:hypothetical protein
MSSTAACWGLCIRGLSDPTGASPVAPVLFTSQEIDASTLPATVPTGAVVRAWIRPEASEFSGIVQSADIRDPVKAGGSPMVVRLVDVDEQLAPLFAEDPVLAETDFFDLTAAKITQSTTSIVVGCAADNPPTAGTYWIEREAVNVSAVAAISGTDLAKTLTIARGQCGSRARVHRLHPAAFMDDGASEKLTLVSRMDFAQRLEAIVYVFKVVAGGVSSVLWMRHGYVLDRPRPTGDGRWEVRVGDLVDAVASHTHGDSTPLEVRLSTCVQSYSETEGSGLAGLAGVLPGALGGVLATATSAQAQIAQIWLTRYEAERLFNEPFRPAADDLTISSSEVDAFEARITNEADFQILAHVKAGGYSWVYELTEVAKRSGDSEVYLAEGVTPESYVVARGRLLAAEPGASLGDSPVSAPETPTLAGREGRNAGWSRLGGDPIREGEDAPVVKLRLRLRTTPVKALLYLLHSDDGSGATDATYDQLPCRWGLGLTAVAPSQVNQGTAAASGIAADEATSALLELGQLLDIPCDFVFEMGGSLGDWLNNLCRVHTLLFGGLPTTGALSLRLWARVLPAATIDTIDPLVGPDDVVDPSEPLEPLRAILVEFGYDAVTLAPLFPAVAIRVKQARADDVKNAQRVRIWLTSSPAASHVTAILGKLKSVFKMLQGEPVLYRVPTFLGEQARVWADMVRWSDTSIPTPSGYGVTLKRHIVAGMETSPATGRQVLKLLPDAANQGETSAGKIAPTLRVIGVISLTTTSAVLQVESLGEASLALTTAHQAIWSDLVSATGYVRILNPTRHNPSTERRGWLEGYATVVAVYDSPAAISLTLDTAWARGGYTWVDIIEAGKSFLCLPDRRSASANVEAVAIGPIAEALYNGGAGDDFLKFAPANGGAPYDAHYSLIST